MTRRLRRIVITAMLGGLVLTLAVVAQDRDKAEEDGGDAQLSSEEIMAKPGDWEDKAVTVRARVKSAAADEDKDFFQLVLDGGLRCRLAKAPIENKYSEMKVQCVSAARGALVKLTHPEVKDAKVSLFNARDELSVSGTVIVKGNNRVLLDNAKVVRYNWPKISGDYFDKYNRQRHYGLSNAERYRDGNSAVANNQDANGRDDEAGIDVVAPEDVMASPAEFNGKKVRVKGHVQRLESGDGRDGFVLLLEGNLRCRMRKTEVEKQYVGHIYHYGSNNEKTPWQLIVGKDGNAKLVRSERERGNYGRDRNIRVQVPIFNRGDEIEITGAIKQASTNRVLLENTSIVTYKWPQASDSD